MNIFTKILIFALLSIVIISHCEEFPDESLELVATDWTFDEIEAPSNIEEYTIVSTVDGNIHALDSQNRKKWTMFTGGSMISSHQISSLNSNLRDYSIIPSLDGSLLVHNSGGMRKTSMKARMLAERTPFISADGELVFTGNRKSKVIGVDVDSGIITHEINMDGDTPIIRNNPVGDKPPLWIGLVDYTVRAFDGTSGVEQFNMSYTEIRPLPHNRLSNHESAILNSHKLEMESARGLVPRESRLPSLSRRAESKALASVHDQSMPVDIAGVSIYHAVHFESPAMSAFRVKRGHGGDGYDIETLRVSNKGVHPHHDDVTAGELIEIRTSADGGLFALHTDHHESDTIDDISSSIEIDPGVRLQDIDSQSKRHNDFNRFSSSRITSHLHSKQPLRGSLPLPSRTSSAQTENDKASVPNTCIPYPNAFKNADEINDTTEKLLQDSRESETTMCLIGHHKLIPGQANDLPFLPADQVEVDNPAPAKTQSIYSLLSRLFRRNQHVIYTLAILILFLILINLERLMKYIKVSIVSALTNKVVLANIEIDSKITSIEIENTETIDEHGRKVVRVGALQVNDKILGYGSQGTVVLHGSLNGRPVAVKKMLSQFSRVADREMSLLIRSDGHPNVVRYFLKEEKGDFIFLALQLCCMSLRDFIYQICKIRDQDACSGKESSSLLTSGMGIVPDEIRLGLLQIAKGVAHLHSHRIVHRDLKPHNILCAFPDESKNSASFELDFIKKPMQLNDFVLKISDMGLSKQLDQEEQSFSMMQSMGSLNLYTHDGNNLGNDANAHVGTQGWQAPELIISRRSYMNGTSSSTMAVTELGSDDVGEEDLLLVEDPATFASVEISATSSAIIVPVPSSTANRKRTQNVDIFSLGCIFYYVLVPGSHPYGAWHDREMNIVNNNMDISSLNSNHDAHDLILRMLHHDPISRPSAQQVHRHPFFWIAQTRLEFLIEISDRLEHEEPDSVIVLSIESNAFDIIGSSWDRRLHTSLLDDIGRFRKYDKSSVRDLLRLIRNKKHHFHELDDQLKALMTPIPQGFLSYFESRFPKLLMHCVKVACTHLATEKHFSTICEGIVAIFADRTTSARTRDSSPSPSISPIINFATDGSFKSTFSAKTDMISSPPSSDRYSSSPQAISHMHIQSEDVDGSDSAYQEATIPTIDQNVIVWFGSALAEKARCKGWLRDADSWTSGMKFGASLKAQSKPRANHLIKASTDFRYRSRLCTHWEMTGGLSCPMRKKGKCDFAHGPLELRIKETRRDKWGKVFTDYTLPPDYTFSGGEDVLGAARSIEKYRAVEGGVSSFEKSSTYMPPPKQQVHQQVPMGVQYYQPYYPGTGTTYYPDQSSYR